MSVGRALGILAAALLAAGSGRAAEDIGLVGQGSEIAHGFCARCHAVAGANRLSPNEAAPPFRTLADDPALTGQAIRQLLRTTHETMPDYILSAEERDALAAYIKSLASR